MQDTGVIQGISQAPPTISFAAMAERQRELAHVILRDPAVESLSSFIGVDGTNTTLNSGRIRRSTSSRSASATLGAADVIRRLQARLAREVDGITLYMQPVQNITVDDRVSRTQYQYTLEDPDADELAHLDRQARRRASRRCRELDDVATDQQPGGLAAFAARSIASPRRGWGSRRRPSTTRSTTRSASARSTRCTRSRTSTT